MYNSVITRISPVAVLKITFCAGICCGGLLGILLGIVEGDTIGLFGGLFFGFLCGFGFGVSGLACTAIFNALVPYIGGIPVTLEVLSVDKLSALDSKTPAPPTVETNEAQES